MKLTTSTLVAVLLHLAVPAATDESADKVGNRPRRLGERNKHRRQRSSPGPVRYFSVPGTHSSSHHHHDSQNRQLQSRIVGGVESDPQEFPYYGTTINGGINHQVIKLL